MNFRIGVFFGMIGLLAGCASKPVLYPNRKFKSVGKERAQAQIERCMADGDAFLESSKGKQILKSAGQGAAVGGAISAALGLLTGNVEEALQAGARGAAVGAAGGAAAGAISPDQIKQRYVNQCLAEKGFRVIGWD